MWLRKVLGALKIWERAVYTRDEVGMGVQFLDTAPDQCALLQQWIQELSASEWTTL
jgi:hypothetical protein